MAAKLRPARAEDYAAYARLFLELGVPDPAPGAARFTDELMDRVLVCDDAGELLGYVAFELVGREGFIRNLVVAPSARGRGVGTALMLAAAAELRRRGATGHWRLNVKVDNAPAIGLYERLGLRAEYGSVAMLVPWQTVARLPTPASDRAWGPATLVEPDDDEALEQALGLRPGRLQQARQRGCILLQLGDERAPLGVAAFDPTFPGAFPFRVADASLAAPLLRALAVHARPGDNALQLVVEDDEALARALLAAGATERYRLLNYAGPLPHP